MSVKISAKDVNKLRKQTGAGMMDCKKALVEAGGDFDLAIDLLRKKGQKIAAKRADRAATEGVAIAKTTEDGTRGIVICLGCETDFVSKSEGFVSFAQQVADLALANNPENVAALTALAMGDSTIGDEVSNLMGRIGEKIEVSYERIEDTLVVPYIHMGYKIGVLVGLNKTGEELEAAAKDIAMQIAAMKPVAVDEAEVPQSIIDKELEIGRQQAIEEGKAENLLDRIAQGKLKRFFKDNTLLHQQFVKDSTKNVKQFLQSIDKDATVTAFKRVAIGG